jgi:hypothetical protein
VVAAVAQPKAQPKRPHADDEINPFDDKVAIRAVCPHCGALDWFEWKFLGHLHDPVCGQSWYAGSGTYAMMQIRAAFSFGHKYAKHTTSGASGEGAWLAKAIFWPVNLLLGLGVRLEFGILMIPIQALAGLFQAKKTTSDIVTRLLVLALAVGGIGFGVYKVQHAPRPQFQQALPARFNQSQPPQPVTTAWQQNVQPPSSFTLAVNTVNGSVSGLLTMNGQTTALNRDGVEQYALVSFNSIKDILWVQCPQGYSLVNHVSSTGNKTQFVPPSANIEILDSGQNSNLTVTCSVASQSNTSPPGTTSEANTAGPLVGTWKADSELITFMPDGTYVDQTPEKRFSGHYSLSGSVLVIKFPELEMTAQVLNLDAQTLQYRKVKVVEYDGTTQPDDGKTYLMTRQ